MSNVILTPELKSVEQLFTGNIPYIVPKYQRNFAWGSDEIEEIWEDINLAMISDSEYFLGTIVLDKGEKDVLEIIDGQQRIACISMIFSAIRNIFLSKNQNGDASKIEDRYLGFLGFGKSAHVLPRLKLNRINNDVFLKYILDSVDQHLIDEALKDKSLHASNKLMLEGYKFFLEKIHLKVSQLGTDYEEFIIPLIDFITESLKMITINVTSHEDANLFFESLNARGKELAISDLVKNRLYMEAGERVEHAEELWEKMEADLVRKSIPEYLRHYWIAKKVDKTKTIVREKGLYRAISDEIKIKRTDPIDLLRDISTSSIDYVKIGDYSLWPDNPSYDKKFEIIIDNLKMFRVTQCHPLLLNTIQFFNNAKEIAKSFKIISNFAFRYYVIGNQSPGNLERLSGQIAYEIRDQTITKASQIADYLRAKNPSTVFRTDFEHISLPKSKKRVARFILAQINDHLAQKSGPTGQEVITNVDPKKVTLEHVLPLNPTKEWSKDFTEGINHLDFVYRLGNTTLLTQSFNREIANQSFEKKKELAFSKSKLPINKNFRSKQKWGNVEIDQRQKQMAKIALEIWEI